MLGPSVQTTLCCVRVFGSGDPPSPSQSAWFVRLYDADQTLAQYVSAACCYK